MLRARFDEYIGRFNAEDPTAFDEFLKPDVRVLNGALEFNGIAAMRDHYENRIWPHFEERLTILRYVSDSATLAVRMWTRFTARHGASTLFGTVETGELFDYRGIVLYELAGDERFASIVVAYNSFINTKVGGETVNMGMPH